MYQLCLTEREWIQNFIISQPETGMGYQLVNIELKDGRVISNVAVLSSQVIILDDSFQGTTEQDITMIAVLNGNMCKNPGP